MLLSVGVEYQSADPRLSLRVRILVPANIKGGQAGQLHPQDPSNGSM